MKHQTHFAPSDWHPPHARAAAAQRPYPSEEHCSQVYSAIRLVIFLLLVAFWVGVFRAVF